MFQVSASLLDACVLAILNEGETYGYILTQNIKEVIDISDSTLYPVLRRLQKEEYLMIQDKPYQGRNRRYYFITDKGKEQYKEYQEQWKNYKKKIDRILLGRCKDE